VSIASLFKLIILLKFSISAIQLNEIIFDTHKHQQIIYNYFGWNWWKNKFKRYYLQ